MPNLFGETLRNLRSEMELSQQQLAQQLFVSRSSIANWENGRRIPDLLIISRLAQLLNVDISVFTEVIAKENVSPEIIIVDDEPILLSGALPVLAQEMPDANIIGFLKASEAVEYAKDTRISIAFLDIELGRTNGIELCDTLMEINPLTNVIFLTSYPDYAVKAWNTKASGFLLKPLQPEDVSEQLRKLRYPIRGFL